jgi:hypothetical protein
MEGLQNIKNPRNKKAYHFRQSLIFFGGGTNYSKKDPTQLRFIKDLVFHVCQRYQKILVVESS